MERERRRDGGKEREEGESIRVRIAYVVKRIWADYCSGCSGPIYPEWEWREGRPEGPREGSWPTREGGAGQARYFSLAN